MEATTNTSTVPTCPTCQCNWTPFAIRPLASRQCALPGCYTRLYPCCGASGKASSCLDCGRYYCAKHVKPTDDEKGRGVCAECFRVHQYEASRNRRLALSPFAAWLFKSTGELILLGLLIYTVLYFGGALQRR